MLRKIFVFLLLLTTSFNAFSKENKATQKNDYDIYIEQAKNAAIAIFIIEFGPAAVEYLANATIRVVENVVVFIVGHIIVYQIRLKERRREL